MGKLNDKKNEIIQLYNSGKSIYDLAKIYDCYFTSIYRLLIRENVSRRKQWDHKSLNIPQTPLSDEQKQIIEGCLLGDGSILSRCNINSYFTLDCIYEEFPNHLSRVLPFERVRLTTRKSKKVIFHGKKYNAKVAHRITTKYNKSLNEFRHVWYPDGKKIVPCNLKLTPTVIKYWFYGDGSTSYIKYKNIIDAYVRISLCTNSFTIDECDFLVSEMKKKCNSEFGIYLSRGKPMLVTLKTSDVLNFFDYIGKCELDCFTYKWKTPKRGR